MTTKHTPATPLPWGRGPWITAHGEAVYANISSGPQRVASVSVHGKIRDSGRHVSVRKKDGGYSGTLPQAHCDRDAAYLCHAVNAYPRLVQAVTELAQTARECIAKCDVHNVLCMDTVLRMESLLRELGED
ncbi:MAG: hypothetical protein ACYDBH_00600 [Acidobacteriaceae bacterium]